MTDVIVLTKDSSRTLHECLAAISKQTIPSRIIIVDGGSTDTTLEIAREFTNTIIHELPRDIPRVGNNCAKARNLGLAASTSKLVAFVDADVIISPNLLKNLSTYIKENIAGVTSGEQDKNSAFQKVMRLYKMHARNFHHIQEVESIATYCALYKRSSLDVVGGFDDSLYGCEDWDLNYRLRKGGWRLLGVPEKPILHLDRPHIRSFLRQMYHYAWARARLTVQKRIFTPIYALPSLILGTMAIMLSHPHGWVALCLAAAGMMGVSYLKLGDAKAVLIFMLQQIVWAAGYLHGLLSML